MQNTLIEQAEARADQANILTGEANLRTTEANVRTQQAETRCGQAQFHTDQAELRTEQANARTTEANTRTDEANIRTEQAESRENEMRASELSYRRLFEAARDGILILDFDTGRISDVNPYLVELLGFSRREMIGKTVGELSPFKDVVPNQTMLDRLQKAGYVRYDNLPLETKNGQHIAVEFVSNVYQAGVFKVIQCNIRNITKSKRNEARFGRLMDSNAQGVIFWNKKGQITEANDFFLRLVGHSRADLEAGTIDWMTMTPPEYAHLDERALKELAAKGVCEAFEKECLRKDGSRVPVLIGAATFEDNPDEGVSFVLDLTERKAAKDDLNRERNLLRLLIDNLPACIYVKNIAGRYLIFNQASVRQLGLKNEAEALGKTVFDFFPQEIARLYEADDQQVLVGGQTITDREEPTQNHEGRRFLYLTTKLPLRDANGVIGLLGISQDITERKEAEAVIRASEEHFRFLNDLSEATRPLANPAQIIAVMARMLGEHLHASRCAYADVEEDGENFTIQHDYTDGCASTVGKYELSRFGERAVSTLNGGQTLIIRNMDAELSPGKGVEMFNATSIKAIIICPLLKDGELRAMMAVHQIVPRDWQPDEIAIVQDVGERCWATIGRRKAEEKNQQLNAELEQRVIERTSQLEAANKELEAFSYSVSHDLRAPLRGVGGYIQMLEENCANQLDAEGNRLLGVVSSEAKRMGQLIDDLLAFSRLGRAHMAKADIDLTTLARSTFESLTRTGPVPDFELKQLPPAPGDLGMLRQVFVNLLGNAIKFSRHQPAPVIEIGSRRGDGVITYYVKDNGAGFDEKYGHKLFGVFQRLHSEDEFEGTGVGLALVQRIIQRHGGKVWAEGKPNQGATFYFTLPVQKEHANE
ncbi:MAG TPA: PAS domain S-box protein [Verrucomicrobiae bacterium]|nr:PAS domain S-box protein [Verrucomicrobiae bacterium]